jgi:PAS domain S-box-containing protein
MFGYSAHEVIGRSIHIIVPADRSEEEETVLARLRGGEKIDHYETERVTKDGRRLNISLTVSPVRNADGQVVGASKVARDITERKLAAEAIEAARRAAEAASRAKDEFLAMLGHELRNPLAPILTALQLMQLRGDDRTARERAVIDRQVRHLVRLVDDLLDVSRITRGKIDLKHEDVELADVVARAVEVASPLLEERQHRLTVAVPRSGLLLRGDVTRLAQAVTNLLTNAAKYTPAGGNIHVRASHEGREAVLSVLDDGVGISPTLLPKVFDLFVQGSQDVDRSQGGLGLGLTIVRNLVELHGGSVEARSAGAGQGSEFVVRLPLLGAPIREASAPTALLGGARLPRKLRVLVVDDNVDAARMIAHALAAFGVDTRMAFDGPSALTIAADFQPEVALLDVGLPVMDGYELAAALSSAGAHPPVLVAITGYGQDADRARSKAAGFSLHLVKPVDLDALNALLDRIAAGRLVESRQDQ